MPDLFGGGSNNTQATGAVNVPITAIAPPWAKNQKDVMTPAFQPGGDALLARQLQQGGFAPGGNAGQLGLMKWLNSFYQPAQTSQYVPPAPPPKPKTPVVPVVPKVPPVGPSGHHEYITGGTGRNSR